MSSGPRRFLILPSKKKEKKKQALKIVRFQRHLPLTIQFYISSRITGVPPLQSDFSGLSSALKDDANEPKKRKEARTKPTKMARKKSTLRMTRTTTDNYLHLLSYQHLRPAYSKVAIAGEKARRNGSAPRPGTASPRKIFVENGSVSCRSSGLAPPNCIWWYFA